MIIADATTDEFINRHTAPSVRVRALQQTHLAEALANLSDDHREVIVLRNLEQLAWNEVARRMERSVDAARMLWTRALKQLRPFLESRE